jgi:FHA domain
MSVREKEHDLAGRIESFVRRFFERVGGTIDFALRRAGRSQVAARTDLSALIPQIERAIETNLRQEESGIGAPNLIELRYDYETYARMGQKRREYLQRELSVNAYEYIYNRRYATLDDVMVKITYDAFTIGLEIRVDFGAGQEAVIAGERGGQLLAGWGTEIRKSCEVALRGIDGFPELSARVTDLAEPISVGRNVANQMIIRDPTVSNFHAAFVLRSDGTLELADRGSANGTYVNGVLIGSGDRTIVRHDDRLRFGDVEMTLSVTMKNEG